MLYEKKNVRLEYGQEYKIKRFDKRENEVCKVDEHN